MAFLAIPAAPEDATFTDQIYRIDASDPVLGWDGTDENVSNEQASQLIENDIYLKYRVDQQQAGGVDDNSLTRLKMKNGVLPQGIPRNSVMYGTYATPVSGASSGQGLPNLIHIDGGVVKCRPFGASFAAGYDTKGPVDYYGGVSSVTDVIDITAVNGQANVLADYIIATGVTRVIMTNGAVSYSVVAPSSPSNGDYWYSMTEEKMFLRSGGAWTDVQAIHIGTIARTPGPSYTAPFTYQYRRDLNMFSAIPAGTVQMHAGASVPEGWLLCNGAELEVADYPRLFAAIGYTWGGDVDNALFQVPDMRGEFVRGLDDSRGIDSGRALGSSQSASIKLPEQLRRASANFATEGTPDTGDKMAYMSDSNIPAYGSDATGYPASGTETRPRNIALKFIIKY